MPVDRTTRTTRPNEEVVVVGMDEDGEVDTIPPMDRRIMGAKVVDTLSGEVMVGEVLTGDNTTPIDFIVAEEVVEDVEVFGTAITTEIIRTITGNAETMQIQHLSM